ncbi:MAG: protein kinase [Planctomyces sp.]|nr:protein kinase [Planctomyces sp.]
MQVPAVSHELLDLLQKSGLYSDAQIRKIAEKCRLADDIAADEAARILVKERVLTPFQAERLLEGRYRGLVIDRYKIREVLGFGGMGCVFIAEDPELDRKVAIKVLSAEHALDAGMLTRMKLEATAGMRLNHPNIIRTYRMDTTGAVHYLVMELVRGISLHELVALHGAIKWQMVCDIGMQAATALSVAHEQGIVHRDIKPANFLIEHDGTTRVLDFGLALMSDVEEDEFSLSMLFGHDCLGTPDYIAPEQTLDSKKVDGRADIYSLGATLYVALTARLPFPEKTNKAKLEAHRTRNPRTVCELRPEIPPGVGAIISRMMEKDPRKRFQTAAEVASAFREYAVRSKVNFDFRELVTLRAKQARSRAEQTQKKSTSGGHRSSITSASGWIQSSGHQLADSTGSFARSETPAIRQASPGPVDSELRQRQRVPAPVIPRNTRTPTPSGWQFIDVNTGERHPLLKSQIAIGIGSEADLILRDSQMEPIQCVIEYDGTNWKFRQESKKFPTFVNGNAEAYAPLGHKSLLRFAGGTQIRLVHLPSVQQSLRRRRRLLLISALILILIGAGYYLWSLFSF